MILLVRGNVRLSVSMKTNKCLSNAKLAIAQCGIVKGMWIAALMLIAIASLPAAEEVPNMAANDARMKWFREAKFGMFIHWGVYAVPRGHIQWRADQRHR